VKNFLEDEIVNEIVDEIDIKITEIKLAKINTIPSDFCPVCDIYSDCNYCAECGREIHIS
jgi:hypothetical protein